jgi:AMMECR1 domain-containing protein
MLVLIKIKNTYKLVAALALPLSLLVSPCFASTAADPPKTSLPELVKLVESVYFGEKRIGDDTIEHFAARLPVDPRFRKPAGVFVTLSRHGKTRACWGTVTPQSPTIVVATVDATMGALTREYRFAPITKGEWRKLKPQVTVIRSVRPIPSIALQNPITQGLLVRSGGKSGVLLPGEASDAYYQLVQCKLKAGIAPGEPYQLYSLRTEIYE